MGGIKVISKEEMDKQWRKKDVAQLAEKIFLIDYQEVIRKGNPPYFSRSGYEFCFSQAEEFINVKQKYLEQK